MHVRIIAAAAFLTAAFGYAPAHAQDAGFSQWLREFQARAQAGGFDAAFLGRVLPTVQYTPRVLEQDVKQPESKLTFEQYRKNIVTQGRICEGAGKLAEHRALLNRVSAAYGVQPQYIVALWGIETSFGKVTGKNDILSALATLAYNSQRDTPEATYKRREMFTQELGAALNIVAGGHAGTDRLTGSWAGAMGQSQFMPSSYLKYAVDGDGDGNANIWTSQPDVFASIANYLRTEGWNSELRWGREVHAGRAVAPTQYGRDKKRPLSYWRQMGVTTPGGGALPMPADGADPLAALVIPGVAEPTAEDLGKPTYLVYGNYDVIMHWNRSTFFATSVGLLADAIASGPQCR